MITFATLALLSLFIGVAGLGVALLRRPGSLRIIGVVLLIEGILAAAAQAGIELRFATAAGAWLAEAEEAGLGDLDYSAVLGQITR